MDIDLEKEDLSIIFQLKDFKTISFEINALSDYNQNFCFIKAIKGDFYLVFADTKHNLQIYDLNKELIVQKTKIHDDWVNSVHHIYDPFLNRDLIITSSDDKKIKLFQADFYLNTHTLKNILTIKNETVGVYRNAFMFSDFKGKKNFIIAELSDYIIAVYDESGKFLHRIDNCYFLDIWYDVKNSQLHLIASYAGEVKFFDLLTGGLTKQFTSHGKLAIAAVVNDLLIMSDESGIIKTFDICHHKLMNEEAVSQFPVVELIVWDIEYFITGLINGQIEFYETKTLTKIRTINTGCDRISYALPFLHPLKGPSLAISGPIGVEQSLLTVLSECKEEKNELF